MKAFTLLLQSATGAETIEGVTRFVGVDSSGSFGIRANHARMISSLTFGLARFCRGDQPWCYLALPGGLLYFSDNRLTITTRSYLTDSDYERISHALQEKLVAQEKKMQTIKSSLHSMEEEMLRRMWAVRRAGSQSYGTGR
ncbi:MAG: F0F1 ATP synthase subunit epsilon [Pontibacterium sp.]